MRFAPIRIAELLWPSKATALRPRLACEISPSGAVGGQLGKGGEFVTAFAPLPPGVFSPGLKGSNFNAPGVATTAIRQALEGISQRDTKMTLVIPDTSVRVLLLDFDSLPARAAEALPILRFRLRKLVPFEVDDAALSYQVTSGKDGLVRAIVAVTPAAVVAEYETAVREAGYEPGAILPSTLAALAVIDDGEPSLIVNRNANSVTTAITRQNDLLLHRTLELAGSESAANGSREPALEPWQETAAEESSEKEARQAVNELQRSVSVAIAYFEDTLAAMPRELLSCGEGGAAELAQLLGEVAVPVRDLAPTPATGGTTSMPRGMLAGIRGALGN